MGPADQDLGGAERPDAGKIEQFGSAGKSDPLDAYRAALSVLSGEAATNPERATCPSEGAGDSGSTSATRADVLTPGQTWGRPHLVQIMLNGN
jgi:hypothetical protein